MSVAANRHPFFIGLLSAASIAFLVLLVGFWEPIFWAAVIGILLFEEDPSAGSAEPVGSNGPSTGGLQDVGEASNPQAPVSVSTPDQ